MERRDFLATLAAPLAPAPARRPNLLILLADDLGYEDLGFTGSDYIRAPNLDALARGGARFTEWYSAAPVCAPSRGALLTGRYPQRNGVTSNGQPLGPDELSLAEILRPAGYRTGLVGKWHLGSQPGQMPNDRGFDRFFGFHSGCIDFYSHRYYWGEPNRVNYHDLWSDREEVFEDGSYSTELFAREAAAFVGQKPDQQFFLYAAFNAPHYPMHAPRKYTGRFAGLPLEKRVRAAMISALDDAVGDIVAALRRTGQLANTLIFFSSDNGATREPRGGLANRPPETGSNKPWRGYKFSLFDGGMHVPALLHWPARVPAGAVRSGLAAHIDIVPTFAAAAGVTLPQDRTFDGRDVTGLARGDASPHQALFWASGKQQAMRQGPWKLVLGGCDFDYLSGKGYVPPQPPDDIFLSNLEDNPGESRNRAQDDPARTASLRRALDDWRAGVTRR